MTAHPSRLLICDARNSPLNNTGSANSSMPAFTAYGWRAPIRTAPAPGLNGQLVEPLTARYYLGEGYREYNPVLMMFQRPDAASPFGRGGLNAYGYCLGDPVNYQDPTGQAVSQIADGLKWIADIFKSPRKLYKAFLSPLPPGVQGIGTTLIRAGYISYGTGGVMLTAGYTAGRRIMNLGGVLHTLGSSFRHIDRGARTLRNSPLGQILLPKEHVLKGTPTRSRAGVFSLGLGLDPPPPELASRIRATGSAPRRSSVP